MGHRVRGGGEHGASLVEFALLIPVLACILLGMVTGGLALADKNSMTNAVREGGRLGATLDGSADWDDWAESVATRVAEVSGGDVGKADVFVCMLEVAITASSSTTMGSAPPGLDCRDPADGGGDEAPPTPSGVAENTCIVKVWAEKDANLNAFFFSRDLTLEANAVGIYELGACS